MNFGFIFSWILQCFAYGTLIINYLASRIKRQHFLLAIYEGFSPFKMVLPHAKARYINGKFSNIIKNFPYLSVTFVYQIFKTDKVRGRKKNNILTFCKSWNIEIAYFFWCEGYNKQQEQNFQLLCFLIVSCMAVYLKDILWMYVRILKPSLSGSTEERFMSNLFKFKISIQVILNVLYYWKKKLQFAISNHESLLF